MLHLIKPRFHHYHFLESTVQIFQIFDIFAILQHSTLSAKADQDHLVHWVDSIDHIIYHELVFVCENDDFVVSRSSLKKSSKSWSLQELEANSKLRSSLSYLVF